MNYAEFCNLSNSNKRFSRNPTNVSQSFVKTSSDENEEIPLAALPPSLNLYVHSSWAKLSWGGTPVPGAMAGIRVYTHKESVSFAVPDADKIGTEFVEKAMVIKYTIRSIDFVSARTKSLSGVKDTEKGSVGINVDISKMMSKESYGEVNAQYERSFEKAFVFHVEQGKKYILVNKLKKLVEDYSVRLEQLKVEHNKKTYQITEDVVTDWMEK